MPQSGLKMGSFHPFVDPFVWDEFWKNAFLTHFRHGKVKPHMECTHTFPLFGRFEWVLGLFWPKNGCFWP